MINWTAGLFNIAANGRYASAITNAENHLFLTRGVLISGMGSMGKAI
jgi:hypothetical protein